MNLDIIYEDNHIIAVNKTNSDIVQSDKTGDKSLADMVKAYIKEKYNKPGDVFLGIVHRLDRPVSGVVIFARTSKALTRLNRMFAEKDIRKTYWAIVKNRPPEIEEELHHYIGKNEEKNRASVSIKPRPGFKEAVLRYKVMSASNNYYLLEIELMTGRHHQIRAQLARIGCPIRGDLKYGYARSNENGGISLHSRSIEFEHPVSHEQIRIVAETPKNEPLWSAFANVQ